MFSWFPRALATLQKHGSVAKAKLSLEKKNIEVTTKEF
jgi:hypothetical protein